MEGKFSSKTVLSSNTYFKTIRFNVVFNNEHVSSLSTTFIKWKKNLEWPTKLLMLLLHEFHVNDIIKFRLISLNKNNMKFIHE